MSADGTRRRLRVRVEGVVQGVGFRPHVYRIATELRTDGWVLNDERGVLAEVEGGAQVLGEFLARLRAEAPPSSAIERIETSEVALQGSAGFAILASTGAARESRAAISPDLAPCEACLRELSIPPTAAIATRSSTAPIAARGSRSSAASPTTDRARRWPRFAMCARVPGRVRGPGRPPLPRPAERLPGVRPAARLTRRPGDELDPGGALDAVAGAARALARRRDRRGQGARRLPPRLPRRRRAGRRAAARAQASRGQAVRADGAGPRRRAGAGRAERARTRRCCARRARPIVLAPRRPDAPPLAPSLAPGDGRPRRDAALLAAAPPAAARLAALHPLVMTSGNVADEPIAYRDDDALARLAAIAERFLLHDRPIHTRTDDSVVRSAGTGVPLISAARAATCRRACRCRTTRPATCSASGAELKSTFCLAKGGPRLGQPPHRRPRATRRRSPPSARASRTSSGCSTSPRGRRARPPPRLPLDPLRAGARRRRAVSPCSTTTRTSPRAPPSTACSSPSSARSSTARASGRRHGLGRRDPGRRPRGLRARRAPVAGPAAGRRRRGPRAVADGVRVAARLRGASGRRRPPASDPAGARAGRSRRSAGPRSRGSRAPAFARRSRPAPGGCSTPSRRSAGCGRTRATRARPRRCSSRAATRASAGAYAMALLPGATAADPRDPRRARADSRRQRRARGGRRARARRGALSQRARRRPGRGLRADRRRARASTPSCSPAACSRTAGCWMQRPARWPLRGCGR